MGKKFESGIRDKHPGSATLFKIKFLIFKTCCLSVQVGLISSMQDSELRIIWLLEDILFL
jgi:hypothetical protein